MKKITYTLLSFIISYSALAQEWAPSEWPSLKSYDKEHLLEIALPMGGIGTGTISLGGRGELRDWEIMNIPGKKYSTSQRGFDTPFFAIYAQEPGKLPLSYALIGTPFYPSEYMDADGHSVNNGGLPHFKKTSFATAYPFGEVSLSDESMPVSVKIKAFNPLIPADADDSSIPVAVLCYEVSNLTDNPLIVSVCGSMRNFVGKDGSKFTSDEWKDHWPVGAKSNKNIYRESDGIKGIFMDSDSVPKGDPAWGTIAITTNSTGKITHRTSSVPNGNEGYFTYALLNFWNDFSKDGELNGYNLVEDEDPMASLAIKKTISPKSKEIYTFYITWDFPNRKAWSSRIEGNYYSTKYKDAWDVAEKVIPKMADLESKTLEFINAFLGSSYPDVVKEAALFNLANLRSQTVFRLPDGHLMGWEGVANDVGLGFGTPTHVWNYELATPFLFGDLACSMRDVEFNYCTRKNGGMNCRALLPLSEANSEKFKEFDVYAVADGQLACIMRFYREWQLSGDKNFLKDNWEQVKKVLAFAWEEKGWDGNQDGVMEGCQHNTMDINYYGPNPQEEFWYLGALKAGKEMAVFMNDKNFADKCDKLFKNGSAWTDANLFNGEYYEQKITDPKTFAFLNMDDPGIIVPDNQLGRGCLVDQLVGQSMAHICGLGYLADKNNIQTTLRSIMKYNYIADFSHIFNNMRAYVLGDESGLIMASWPKGMFKNPFPYFNEVMTGFEYTAAIGMIYEGQIDDALTCIKSIRDRFDGAKRNPFNENEYGYHYARALASWGAILAYSKFEYSGINKAMSITAKPGRYFWSNGYAWGICEVSSNKVTIEMLKGDLDLRKFSLSNRQTKSFKKFNIPEGSMRTISFN